MLQLTEIESENYLLIHCQYSSIRETLLAGRLATLVKPRHSRLLMYGLIELRILEAKSYGTLYVISQARNERLQRVSIKELDLVLLPYSI